MADNKTQNIGRSMGATAVSQAESAIQTASTVAPTAVELLAANPLPKVFGTPEFVLGNGRLSDITRGKDAGSKREIVCIAKIPILGTGLYIAANVFRVIKTVVTNGQETLEAEYGVYWPKQGFEAGIGTTSNTGVENQNNLDGWLMAHGEKFHSDATAGRPTSAGKVSMRPRLVKVISTTPIGVSVPVTA